MRNAMRIISDMRKKSLTQFVDDVAFKWFLFILLIQNPPCFVRHLLRSFFSVFAKKNSRSMLCFVIMESLFIKT